MKLRQGGVFALGIEVGFGLTLTGLLWLDYFHNVISVTSELWAAMIGAVLGGGISLAGVILQNEHQRAEMDAERNLSDLAVARSLFLILLEIEAGIRAVRQHIEEGLIRADQLGETYRSLTVMELAGDISVSRIPNEAKVLLMSSKSLKLFNLIDLQDLHSKNLLALFNRNQERRSELLSLMDVGVVTAGGPFTPVSGREQEAFARNSVLEQSFLELVQTISGVEADLRECLTGTADLIRSLGDREFKFEFKK